MSHDSADLTLFKDYLAAVAPQGRAMLLPALHQAQSIYGWLPTNVQDAISRALHVPLADIHGVIEFYTMFYNAPMAKKVVRVCEDSACRMQGSAAIMQAIEQKIGLQNGETNDAIAYEHVPCLGLCEHAPAALIGEKPAGDLQVADVDAFLAGTYPEPNALPYGEKLYTLARIGRIDPTSLSAYSDAGGYTVLPAVLKQSPDELIKNVDQLAIFGRGGAQFPLGRKWLFTRGAAGAASDKHIVVNSDESEPGTFKDRGLIEEDPFAIIEAMTIAAYAVGAENGWIFVRGEYPRGFARLQNAVAKAKEAGYLGQNILGKLGFNFDVEVRLGAGAYICGEETALFEAIEGRRGFPRIKPPFPTTNGLFDQPTCVNNVETLAAMLTALQMGSAQWQALGTEKSNGTKLFCLSGNIAKPGVYEEPFGLTIRELIDKAGGVPNGKAIKAVLIGGAAGKFITPDKLDTPLSYEGMRSADLPLGSGVVMVFDEDANIGDALYDLSRFFAHESCGKCFPCQLGTQRQLEIVDRIVNNNTVHPSDKQILLDVGFAMTETSLCGLGQTAASAVISAIEIWPELVEGEEKK